MAVTQSLQRRSGSVAPSIRQDETDLHIDPILGDLAVADHDLLLLDPGALDVPQGLVGPGDPLGDLTRQRYQAAAKALGEAGLAPTVPDYEVFHVPLR